MLTKYKFKAILLFILINSVLLNAQIPQLKRWTSASTQSDICLLSFNGSNQLLAADRNGKIEIRGIKEGLPLEKTINTKSGILIAALETAKPGIICLVSRNGEVKLFNLDNNSEINSEKESSVHFTIAKASSDKKFLVTGDLQGKIILWDMESLKKIAETRAHSEAVTAIAISPDNKFVFSGSSDNTVTQWNTDKLIRVRNFTGHTAWINDLAVSEDSKYLLSGSGDKKVKIWFIENGASAGEFKGHLSEISNLFSLRTDKPYEISISWDGVFNIWNPVNLSEDQTYELPFGVLGNYTVSSKKDLFAFSGEKLIYIYKIESKFPEPPAVVQDIVVNPEPEPKPKDDVKPDNNPPSIPTPPVIPIPTPAPKPVVVEENTVVTPIIILLEPIASRNIVVVKKEKDVLVRGYVTDKFGLKEVIVNDIKAAIKMDSLFEITLKLKAGGDIIKVRAIDNKNNIAEKFFPLGKPPVENTAKEMGERKIALVVGNSNYKISPLSNPVNDARDMAVTLKSLGFEVIEKEDLSQNDIKRAIREFGNKLSGGGVGLFYYAGHGMQVKGRNYLIPVNAEIKTENDVEYEAVDLGLLMAQLEVAKNRLNIVILDACRNNPFAKTSRSLAGDGLAQMSAPFGTLLAYSTSPGSVASDGSDGNGLYTQELIQAMDIPNLKIEDVFKKVRTNVRKMSNNEQVPWESTSIEGDFYFVKRNN